MGDSPDSLLDHPYVAPREISRSPRFKLETIKEDAHWLKTRKNTTPELTI
jgi:hypothetical protein